jgi:type I restriction enzyme M protein
VQSRKRTAPLPKSWASTAKLSSTPRRARTRKSSSATRSKGFTKIPTNPPFGAVIKEELHSYLKSYELSRYIGKGGGKDEDDPEDDSADPKAGKKAIKQRASVKTEVIYCERIWQLLKPGGQAAVVLPDGLLTNASLQGVRDWMLERFKVLAVVSLPQFAFAHFGAGVKSSVVFLEKRQPGTQASDDEAIFMAMAENIGYDATGRVTYQIEVLQELPEQRRVERQRCDLFDWKVEFDWVPGEGKKPGRWSERHRKVIPGSGLLASTIASKRTPNLFSSNPRPRRASHLLCGEAGGYSGALGRRQFLSSVKPVA